MKFLAQLQMWEPLVLLQSWEQVPKRRHSLTSGQQGRELGGDQEGIPHPPHSPYLCPKDTNSDAPEVQRHISLAKTNRNPNSTTPTLSGSTRMYLGRNSCSAPSGSLCGTCSTWWSVTECTGPRLRTWWCWSCSRMTCGLGLDAPSAPVPTLIPPPGHPSAPTHRGSRNPRRNHLRSHQRSCSGGWR